MSMLYRCKCEKCGELFSYPWQVQRFCFKCRRPASLSYVTFWEVLEDDGSVTHVPLYSDLTVRKLAMSELEWIFDDPGKSGWYAVQGIFPDAAYFDGVKWSETAVGAYAGPFASEKEAHDWAYANDPERIVGNQYSGGNHSATPVTKPE